LALLETKVCRNRLWLVPALIALAVAVLPGVALAGSGGAAPGSINANLLHLGDRMLSRGMDGRDVRELQGDLTTAGIATQVTGHYGWTTRKHVIAFQVSKHLQPTGVVSIGLARRLRKVAATIARHRVTKARIRHGLAIAPSNAPASIKAVIAAANRIAFKPYIYGGGHGSWNDSGYDCSGSVSYALHGAHLISSPEDSSELEAYGSAGRGRWITIWANAGHTYMYVAGLRFDTSAQSSTGGSRWTSQSRSNGGFVERHPRGL
jgi:Putative peptidoglycan binding domain